MIRSMTGFGRDCQVLNGLEILVEIRSVNQRYFEFTARLPRAYIYLEEKLKLLLRSRITRGKVEASVLTNNVSGDEKKIAINVPVVREYVTAFRSLPEEFALDNSLSFSDIFRMSDAFSVTRVEIDEEEIWRDVKAVTAVALEKFVFTRETEGRQMESDILSRLDFIENAVFKIERFSPESVTAYREKLFEKMKEIFKTFEIDQIDEQRVLTEAAIFSERTAVDEETVRMKSHIAQIREMIATEDNIGRKLDFIVQELNREVNTIGSKAQNLQITKIVLDVKSEIEKIREQIQNIE